MSGFFYVRVGGVGLVCVFWCWRGLGFFCCLFRECVLDFWFFLLVIFCLVVLVRLGWGWLFCVVIFVCSLFCFRLVMFLLFGCDGRFFCFLVRR